MLLNLGLSGLFSLKNRIDLGHYTHESNFIGFHLALKGLGFVMMDLVHRYKTVLHQGLESRNFFHFRSGIENF